MPALMNATACPLSLVIGSRASALLSIAPCALPSLLVGPVGVPARLRACTGRKTGLSGLPVVRPFLHPGGGSKALADAAPLAENDALRGGPDPIPGRIVRV